MVGRLVSWHCLCTSCFVKLEILFPSWRSSIFIKWLVCLGELLLVLKIFQHLHLLLLILALYLFWVFLYSDHSVQPCLAKLYKFATVSFSLARSLSYRSFMGSLALIFLFWQARSRALFIVLYNLPKKLIKLVVRYFNRTEELSFFKVLGENIPVPFFPVPILLRQNKTGVHMKKGSRCGQKHYVYRLLSIPL